MKNSSLRERAVRIVAYTAFLFIPIVFGLSIVLNVSGDSSGQANVKHVGADGLQFTLETGEFVVDADNGVSIAELDTRLNIPGAPALPYYSTYIALPPEADATVNVSADGVVTQAIGRIQPTNHLPQTRR